LQISTSDELLVVSTSMILNDLKRPPNRGFSEFLKHFFAAVHTLRMNYDER